jgi:hypothetical protein
MNSLVGHVMNYDKQKEERQKNIFNPKSVNL